MECLEELNRGCSTNSTCFAPSCSNNIGNISCLHAAVALLYWTHGMNLDIANALFCSVHRRVPPLVLYCFVPSPL